MSVPDTTWISGQVSQSGTSTWTYRGHCYGNCGSNNDVPPCTATYYIPSTYSVTDHTYDTTSNGVEDPTQWGTCIDTDLCTDIGGIKAQAQWDPSNSPNGSIGNMTNTTYTPIVSCYYPLATFYDLQYVIEFYNKYVDPNSPDSNANNTNVYNKTILPAFCTSQTSASCPTDPATDQPMKSCSYMVSGIAGNPCRSWLNNGTTDADGAMDSYCGFFNTPDCSCINRFTNPVYQAMAPGESVCEDTCWWKPCQDTQSETYLVPSTTPVCNCTVDQYCPSINVIIGGNSQNFTANIQNYTTCSLTNNNNPSGNNGSIWSNWWWLIILITVILAIIIIIMIILL